MRLNDSVVSSTYLEISRIFEPAHEIFVLIILLSHEDSCEPAHIIQGNESEK